MHPLMHPGKMHQKKVEGVGTGVLVFCKAAKGQLGRGGGIGLPAPGPRHMLRQVTQCWKESM